MKCIALSEWDLIRHRGTFEAQVRKRGPKDCWLWTGATCGTKSSNGKHACFSVVLAGQKDKTSLMAHRCALFYFEDRLPRPNEIITRTCGNPMCVNPAHFDIEVR